MTFKPLRPLRRVITAKSAEGRSYLLEDGPSPATYTVDEWPGFRSTNVWRTVDGPTAVDAEDSIVEHKGVMPPPGGTLLRVVDTPPTSPDPEIRRQQIKALIKKVYPDSSFNGVNPQPGMHTTYTIDYAIVLSGTITAIMDDSVTDLHAGDILIQRATSHTWENRTNEMARVCFVLVAGK